MTTPESDFRGRSSSVPTDRALLGNPLEFIHADHLREREICAMLDRIAGAEFPDRDEVSRVLGYLREELPLHVADEDEDMFPLLRRRCAPEDEIDKAIMRLSADHRRDGKQTPEVIAILEESESGERGLSDEARSTLVGYAALARNHLILENAIILPFARLRLTEHDLETLRLRMLQRRGLDRLRETPHAE